MLIFVILFGSFFIHLLCWRLIKREAKICEQRLFGILFFLTLFWSVVIYSVYKDFFTTKNERDLHDEETKLFNDLFDQN